MNISEWRWVKGLSTLLAAHGPEPARQARRIVAVQLHVVLPAKAGVLGVLLYYVFYSGWLADIPQSAHSEAVTTLRGYFPTYIFCNVIVGLVFLLWRRFPPGIFQWLVFTLGILDGIFVAALTFLTGGFESMVFWIFPGLIVLNALSIPLATPQIVLNLFLIGFYVVAGIGAVQIPFPLLRNQPMRPIRAETAPQRPPGPDNRASLTNRTQPQANVETNVPPRTPRIGRFIPSEMPTETETDEDIPSFLPQICVLLLLTACCYGVQVLADRQRRLIEEAREFAMREGRLQSAGRLAAEIAHQLKNPLAIINNAAFSMQRTLKDGRNDVSKQLEIIKDEVERSDRILTEIMGYAQLSEGRVEKLDLIEELDRAIHQVFPPAAGYGVRIERQYASYFPPLLMQRRHLMDVFVNILQNARESLNGTGKVVVVADCKADYSIEVSIGDSGPGIARDKLEKVFEAYYTTREKGTGLGLAIVKHNVELYGGTVRAESELGKGARFILVFPARTVINLATNT